MAQWIWEQEICREIFEQKYCLQGEKSVEEVFHGVASEIASVEKDAATREQWENAFYTELVAGRLQPAGRILANARPASLMKNYNNCFTIDIEDSLEGIYDSLKEDATISKMGGGVGFDISKLRPKAAKLSNGGESSGVISFLRIFDQSAKTIMTGGQRRSAHIALLDISHPEIEDFITSKKGEQNKELTQFNISVKISDAFIEAVKNDTEWDLVFKGKIYKTVRARDLYDQLAKNAFTHNEPGIFNADTVERYNNGYWAFKMDRVNPCGELVMPSYSLCCLSSINLALLVRNPFTKEATFDFEAFAKTVSVGVRFLDDVLDATAYPLDKIKTFSRQWRRIGLGFTALADAFAMLGLRYGDVDPPSRWRNASRAPSGTRPIRPRATSQKKKVPSPPSTRTNFSKRPSSKHSSPELREKIRTQGMRNIQLNTVAPTGTTSLSMGQNCSSGIEPIFARSFKRTIRTGVGDETRTEEVSDYAWKLWKDAQQSGTQHAGARENVAPGAERGAANSVSTGATDTQGDFSAGTSGAAGSVSASTQSGAATVAQSSAAGSVTAGETVATVASVEVPPFFVTTVDIDAYKSIDMQAIVQKYIDHSISKTLNLQPGTSFEEYKNLFMYGYEKGTERIHDVQSGRKHERNSRVFGKEGQGSAETHCAGEADEICPATFTA